MLMMHGHMNLQLLTLYFR